MRKSDVKTTGVCLSFSLVKAEYHMNYQFPVINIPLKFYSVNQIPDLHLEELLRKITPKFTN